MLLSILHKNRTSHQGSHLSQKTHHLLKSFCLKKLMNPSFQEKQCKILRKPIEVKKFRTTHWELIQTLLMRTFLNQRESRWIQLSLQQPILKLAIMQSHLQTKQSISVKIYLSVNQDPQPKQKSRRKRLFQSLLMKNTKKSHLKKNTSDTAYNNTR